MQQVNSIFSTSTSSSKPNLRQCEREFLENWEMRKSERKKTFSPAGDQWSHQLSKQFLYPSLREFILSKHFRRILCGQLQRGKFGKQFWRGEGTGSRKSVCEKMEEKCTLGLERKGHSGKRAVETKFVLLAKMFSEFKFSTFLLQEVKIAIKKSSKSNLNFKIMWKISLKTRDFFSQCNQCVLHYTNEKSGSEAFEWL